MIRAIVFDLWETLGTKNIGVSETLRQEFDIPKSDTFLRRYEEAVQLQAWDTEEQMAVSFLEAFNVEPTSQNIAFVINVFRQGIECATLFEGMSDLLQSIKSREIKLGLLSNTTIFESSVLDRLKIAHLFDAVVLSCDIGVLKPSPLAFNNTLKMLGVDTGEALFIDDGIVNIKAAKTLGINALQFKGVETLQIEMKQFGINIQKHLY